MTSTAESKLSDALELLWDHYGKEIPDGEDDILGTLVRTILSQSTNKSNTDRAFGNLLDQFEGDWGRVERAPVEDVRAAIEVGGLANQKAPRIQAILQWAREHSESGGYELEFLRYWEAAEALKCLTSLPGVGPKTARFVLMYAAGADLFPMDTHIFRFLERFELLPDGLSDRKAHEYAERLVPDGEAYPAHMVLVEHGRVRCRARNPECAGCPVHQMCPWEPETGDV